MLPRVLPRICLFVGLVRKPGQPPGGRPARSSTCAGQCALARAGGPADEVDVSPVGICVEVERCDNVRPPLSLVNGLCLKITFVANEAFRRVTGWPMP